MRETIFTEPIEVRTFGVGVTLSTLGEFIRFAGRMSVRLSKLEIAGTQDSGVWIDTGWQDGGELSCLSARELEARIVLKQFSDLDDIDLIPEALGFAGVVRSAEFPEQHIEPILSNLEAALTKPASIPNWGGGASLTLQLGSYSSGAVSVHLHMNEASLSCSCRVDKFQNNCSRAEQLLHWFALETEFSIIMSDACDWRKRYTSETKRTLELEPDIAVGWRTFLRNAKAVEMFSQKHYSSLYSDGVLLSFGETPKAIETSSNIIDIERAIAMLAQ